MKLNYHVIYFDKTKSEAIWNSMQQTILNWAKTNSLVDFIVFILCPQICYNEPNEGPHFCKGKCTSGLQKEKNVLRKWVLFLQQNPVILYRHFNLILLFVHYDLWFVFLFLRPNRDALYTQAGYLASSQMCSATIF